MTTKRRHFLRTCVAVAFGFFGLGLHSSAVPQLLSAAPDRLSAEAPARVGYGPLLPDPAGLLDLPAGFTYTILSRAGDEMNDGLLVPAMPDGMGAFPGPEGTTIVICNHELVPGRPGAFGESNERLGKVPTGKLYDHGMGMTPSNGGTRTFVFDPETQTITRQFLSLAGTLNNCAGGVTPWGTWISCEEIAVGVGHAEEQNLWASREHGYNFEVPATAQPGLVEPVPLKAMGRFVHEAVGVDPKTGIVYQTEDLPDGLIYRFIPNQYGRLAEGGRLQALCLIDRPGADSRNWNEDDGVLESGKRYTVRWLDLDQPEAPEDDLRMRGYAAGACRFTRGEGMWVGTDGIYFTCTDGGRARIGQIWRYRPSPQEGQPGESKEPPTLELFLEIEDEALGSNIDNLTIAPWGDLLVCEDRGPTVDNRLIGVTPDGTIYSFAVNHANSEFAGAVFTPDHSTLLVNIQAPALTVAVTGPWRQR